MVVVKDSQYWQVYNQKRKDYLSQKKREAREKLKTLSTTEPLKVVDNEKNNLVVDIPQVVDKNISVVDTKPKKVVDTEIKMSTTEKWSFEIFLEKGFLNKDCWTTEKIQEIKNHSLNYWKANCPYYYQQLKK